MLFAPREINKRRAENAKRAVKRFVIAAVVGTVILCLVTWGLRGAIEWKKKQYRENQAMAVISETIAPSETDMPSATLSITPSLTHSLTPSLTPTATLTPSITPSLTSSWTPSLTPTETITPMPTVNRRATLDAGLTAIAHERQVAIQEQEMAMKRKDRFITGCFIIPGSLISLSIAAWATYRMWRPELEKETSPQQEQLSEVTARSEEQNMVDVEVQHGNQIFRYFHKVDLDVFLDFCEAVISDERSIGINAMTGDNSHWVRIDGKFDRAKIVKSNPRGYQPFLYFFIQHGLLTRATDSKHSELLPTARGEKYFREMVQKYK